ncbi:DUF5677 domain-containing protein [Paenibacillus periandrae]|uniref:DUF5677 domain-containing protein n=1 Tax=Paenibacillus periandrae TaxID=1761741 RepID=UPI001F09F9DF|nr:DUF5677 domain-containing protein [Paenibacillus periandrae]
MKKSLFTSLDYVDEGFITYLDKMQIDFPVWLDARYLEYEEPLHLLLTYYYFLNYIADEGVLFGNHRGTLLLASKTITDLLGVYSCSKSGCIHQASTITRSLFETVVATKFIYLDYEQRIDLFYDFKYIEQHQRLQKDQTAIEAYMYEEIERKYQEIKFNYNPKSSWYSKLLLKIIQSDPRLRGKHRKATLRALCDAVDMNEDYDRIYSSLSLTVHGSPVLDHLFVENGNFTAAPVFNSLVFTQSSLAMNYAHKIFCLILERIDNDKALQLIDYSRWLLYASLEITQKNNK